MTVKFSKADEIIETGECLRGLNILGHSQLIELSIGSTCGGHGKCGKDKIMLCHTDQSKVNPPTEAEKFHLSPAELAEGFRLACQTFPNQDGLDISCHF